jgi:hypothetical protein
MHLSLPSQAAAGAPTLATDLVVPLSALRTKDIGDDFSALQQVYLLEELSSPQEALMHGGLTQIRCLRTLEFRWQVDALLDFIGSPVSGDETLAEPMNSAHQFFNVLFRSFVPQRPLSFFQHNQFFHFVMGLNIWLSLPLSRMLSITK